MNRPTIVQQYEVVSNENSVSSRDWNDRNSTVSCLLHRPNSDFFLKKEEASQIHGAHISITRPQNSKPKFFANQNRSSKPKQNPEWVSKKLWSKLTWICCLIDGCAKKESILHLRNNRFGRNLFVSLDFSSHSLEKCDGNLATVKSTECMEKREMTCGQGWRDNHPDREWVDKLEFSPKKVGPGVKSREDKACSESQQGETIVWNKLKSFVHKKFSHN
jgi:hypothetical protein